MIRHLCHSNNTTKLSDIVLRIVDLIFSIIMLSQIMIVCSRLTPLHITYREFDTMNLDVTVRQKDEDDTKETTR